MWTKLGRTFGGGLLQKWQCDVLDEGLVGYNNNNLIE
jgi:hypothetical protein